MVVTDFVSEFTNLGPQDQAFEKQVECTKQARLVGLQILFKRKNSTVSILALPSDHVRNFLNSHSNFYEVRST